LIHQDTIEDLVTRASTGNDPAAFEELAERLYQRVYNWIVPLVHDPYTAEDLCQETWIKIGRSIGRYQPGSNFIAWAHTIAKNTTLDHFRATQRRPAESLTPNMLWLDRPQSGQSVEELAERRALASAICTHLDKLRPQQRHCLLLRFFSGLTTAQTAEIMGKKEGAVRTLQSRALKKLNNLLPAGESAASLVEELLAFALRREQVVGTRVDVREAAPHVETR
jgi:RNA polymerase sigma factor (sigma-70 family)